MIIGSAFIISISLNIFWSFLLKENWHLILFFGTWLWLLETWIRGPPATMFNCSLTGLTLDTLLYLKRGRVRIRGIRGETNRDEHIHARTSVGKSLSVYNDSGNLNRSAALGVDALALAARLSLSLSRSHTLYLSLTLPHSFSLPLSHSPRVNDHPQFSLLL